MIGATHKIGANDNEASTTVSRDINAPVERVFDAFGQIAALQAWFRPDPTISLAVRSLDFRAGGRFVFDFGYADGTVKTLRGDYIRIIAPYRIEFTWIWDAPDEHQGIETQVTIDLEPRDGKTRLVVTHAKLPQTAARQRYQIGWAACWDALEVWIEKTRF